MKYFGIILLSALTITVSAAPTYDTSTKASPSCPTTTKTPPSYQTTTKTPPSYPTTTQSDKPTTTKSDKPTTTKSDKPTSTKSDEPTTTKSSSPSSSAGAPSGGNSCAGDKVLACCNTSDKPQSVGGLLGLPDIVLNPGTCAPAIGLLNGLLGKYCGDTEAQCCNNSQTGLININLAQCVDLL